MNRALIEINPRVLEILGLTEEQIQPMNLREFSDAVFAKGYRITVGSTAAEPTEGGLLITVSSEALDASPIVQEE